MSFNPTPRMGKVLGGPSKLEGWDRHDLNKALSYLGWTGAELGRRTGMGRNQVSRWRRGNVRVPKLLEAYMRVMIRLADIVDGN